MTLVSTRVVLVHRTNILRSNGTDNSWGHKSKDPEDWQPAIENVTCRGYVFAARQVIEDGAAARSTVTVEDRRLIVPLDTDVKKTDRVDDITYRGVTIIEGPMTIEAIVIYSDRRELYLKRVS